MRSIPHTAVLVVDDRPIAAGVMSACWAAARYLDLTRDRITQDGTRIEGLAEGVQIALWHGDIADAPPELSNDGRAFANGDALPNLVDATVAEWEAA